MWTGNDAQTAQPLLLGGSCSSLARENKVGAAERDAKRDWVAEERGKRERRYDLDPDDGPCPALELCSSAKSTKTDIEPEELWHLPIQKYLRVSCHLEMQEGQGRCLLYCYRFTTFCVFCVLLVEEGEPLMQ
jgi:hypothetical protein